jgi:hypothetical protein
LELDGYDIYKNKDEWYAISPSGGRIDFKLDSGVCRRMAYIDLRAPEEHFFDDGLAMVQTMRGNYEGFTKAQVMRAREARRATVMMAHPTDERLKHVVSNTNVVPNCTFNATDLTNAHAIYGPDRGGLRGKTVRKRPEPVRPEFITIPQDLYEKVVNVTLTADVMFVNGLPFLITQSRGIRLLTIEFLPSRTAEQLSKSLLKIARMIRTCLMDMEFECFQEAIDYLLINCTSAREHVTDIERSIRTVKERSRSVVSELPYADCMPDQMVIHLLYFVCMWINAFPSENGVSTQYSPREIVTGTKMDYNKHCKALWGSYVEASEDADITNTLKQRTYPCIVLGPTGNFQGSVKCFNLETKQVIKRRTVTELPMPDRVIRRVINLGKKKAKQTRTSKKLQFLNRHKESFDWDNDDLDGDEVLVEPPPCPTNALPAELPGVLLESDQDDTAAITPAPRPSELDLVNAARANANIATTSPGADITGVELEETGPVVVSDDEADGDEESQSEDEVEFLGENLHQNNSHELVEIDEATAEPEPSEVAGEIGDEEDDDSDAESDRAVAGLRRSKRKRVKRQPAIIDFKNLTYALSDGVIHINPPAIEQTTKDFKVFDLDGKENIKEKEISGRMAVMSPPTAGVSQAALKKVSGLTTEPVNAEVSDGIVMHVMGVILAQQYSVNKGIKLFGERATDAISKELQQLHDYGTYTPIHAHELTREERKDALSSLMFLTEKRCGKIKSRACVNGSTQRDYIPKETTASPTVMNDSVMITSAIEAHEGRKVVTMDIPGAFLHADLDEEVVMLLRGQLADLMVQVDPELYGPYLIKSAKGESILYVRMLKAMYGLLRSALLFYLKLVKDLRAYGFELNEYDPCVANKMVNGAQMTV